MIQLEDQPAAPLAETASARDAWSRTLYDSLRPDEVLSVSEWSERHRVLDQKSAALPGRWSNDLTPYLVEIMDSLGPDATCTRVTFQKGAQVGGTEAGNNWLGWIMDQQPAPAMYVLPTKELAEDIAEDRIDPLIQATPRLSSKVAARRAREGGSTQLRKNYPGGVLVLAGANSGASLRSRPFRFLFKDELDAWQARIKGEGDPSKLAERGTRTFGRARKVFEVSTPTLQGASRIEASFYAGDRSYYHVPCPECMHYQRLRWSNIKEPSDGAWKRGEYAGTAYACEGCGVLIPEHRKPWMLERGRWIAERPQRSSDHRSFHLSALYSPLGWYSWAQGAEDWITAQNDRELLQAFVNLVLGETWVEKGDAPDFEVLMARAEPYEIGTVPTGGLLLTCGIDVQADRLEAEVVAWGEGRESWSVEHVVIPGKVSEAKTRAELDKLLGGSWPHESGVRLPIVRACIDSGYNAHEVYNYVRGGRPDQLLAIKGDPRMPAIIGQPRKVEVNHRGKRIRRGVSLWPVGVDQAKSELYGWLHMKAPKPGDPFPAGWCHLPHHPQEWFEQLVAEHLEPQKVAGRTVFRWVKTRERNEALDCRIYARAAAVQVGIDRWGEEEWAVVRANLAGQAAEPPARQEESRRRARRTRGEGGWFDRWS